MEVALVFAATSSIRPMSGSRSSGAKNTPVPPWTRLCKGVMKPPRWKKQVVCEMGRYSTDSLTFLIGVILLVF